MQNIINQHLPILLQLHSVYGLSVSLYTGTKLNPIFLCLHLLMNLQSICNLHLIHIMKSAKFLPSQMFLLLKEIQNIILFRWHFIIYIIFNIYNEFISRFFFLIRNTIKYIIYILSLIHI